MMFETGHAALLVTALSFFLIGHLALSLCGPKRARSATEWTLTALMVGAVICIVSSIAAVIAFALSGEAPHMTGTDLKVDGGRTSA